MRMLSPAGHVLDQQRQPAVHASTATLPVMVNPTWEDRDLPVLRAFVELWEESGGQVVTAQQLEHRTGFDQATTQSALAALIEEEPKLIGDHSGAAEDGAGVLVLVRPTGEARRRLNLWPPTPDLLADRLIQALARAADNEPDEEKRGWLRRTAAYLGSAGRDLAIEVAASALTKSTGLG